MCFMSAQNTYNACVRAGRCPRTRAHTFPAEDQSAERSHHRSIQTAKRLSVDASPAFKQPITLSLVGRRQTAANQLSECCHKEVGVAAALGTAST